MEDVLGRALHDYYHRQRPGRLMIYNTYGKPEHMPLDIYFRGAEKMPELELHALAICSGKILDIGAGAGSHALYLRQKGHSVAALELSPLSVEVMQQRGVQQVIQHNIFTFAGSRYDTLLLLMNGIGLVGTIDGLRKFLRHAKSLINPGGQLLFDSSDVAYLYDGTPDTENYYGELSYRYKYKKQQTDWFTWLYIDQKTLTQIAAKEGWKTTLIFTDEFDQYLVRMTLNGDEIK